MELEEPSEATRLLFQGTGVHGSNDTKQQQQTPILIRHDSEFSVNTSYSDGASGIPRLNLWQGAALLTADCLGTGLLALPADIHVLGMGLGLGFLIANLPINLYAGTIFHLTASDIEERQLAENRIYQQSLSVGSIVEYFKNDVVEDQNVDYREVNQNTANSVLSYLSMTSTNGAPVNQGPTTLTQEEQIARNQDTINSNVTFGMMSVETAGTAHTQLHHDTATFDFIGITQALFSDHTATRWVMMTYYVNIFLVLGNYILVMSHAVAAVVGEDNICLPTAGLLASIGMFLVSQLRTMARLGRTATIVSLSALFIVVIQCLWALRMAESSLANDDDVQSPAVSQVDEQHSLLRKLSAFGSIGFAVGSQKLFLNIRHELANRSVAPHSLAVSLSAFGTFYVLIVLVAGPNPPSFLFDAIQPGWNRRLAGLLLWGHVIVSYAINSQAICSSMDRLLWHRWLPDSYSPAMRWLVLTAIMAVAAYTVANAIPFFTDLVALVGSLTSVPLTLLLPAIFWRKHLSVPLWWPTTDSKWSAALLYFSVVFCVTATVGSLYSIEQDWARKTGPFSCH